MLMPLDTIRKRPKTAEAYQNLVYKEWWTNVEGKVNQNGAVSFPAFFGKYKITIDGKSKEIELTKASGEVVVEF